MAFEDARQLLRETGFLLDQVPAHVDDLVDVLDHDRARLLAGAAGVAGPDHLVLDDLLPTTFLPTSAGSSPSAGFARDALGDDLVLVL